MIHSVSSESTSDAAQPPNGSCAPPDTGRSSSWPHACLRYACQLRSNARRTAARRSSACGDGGPKASAGAWTRRSFSGRPAGSGLMDDGG
ncbi:hypothetical protein CDD83_3634 [Cordyceps sp. RAO-2017]|nr:hypothetical protein CDD83_3634 [Cordyceps sp. RAO-2017]